MKTRCVALAVQVQRAYEDAQVLVEEALRSI